MKEQEPSQGFRDKRRNSACRFSHSCAIGLLSATLLTCLPPVRALAELGDGKGSEAVASIHGETFTLGNQSITQEWSLSGGSFRPGPVTDGVNGKTLTPPNEVFAITLRGSGVLKASDMLVLDRPDVEDLREEPNASRRSRQLHGKDIVLHLESIDHQLGATWRCIMRDGANYIRQELTLQAKKQDVGIAAIRLIDLSIPDAHVAGTVKGSPLVADNMFFGFEHPLSESKVARQRAIASISRELPLRAGQSVSYSSVIGVAEPGQLRRRFLRYLERERAHPYRTFLHYNTWYDIGYSNPYDETAVVNVIDAFGLQLTTKRGVKLDSFLFDDGWDNHKSLWNFNSGFPDGFTLARRTAAQFNAGIGVWMSPWGGYGDAHRQRIKFGKEQGFETNEGGFMLSGPKYYARFRDACLEMIRKYGVNQFKIDGTGNVNQAFAGSEFDSDFAAAIHLIGELRAEEPDLFVNLTTGTYPSPFWLQYADSIWRGGEDHSFAGVGSFRQRWITYRDANTYNNVVLSGPLFPLNSLMLHGMIYAKHAEHLDTDPDNDFPDEVHDYFGTGTQLQEMYITPSLLSSADWDTLAECAKWSRENADVLVDTHWVGGDPAMLEVYGWAAWSPRKGILTLRNPSNKPQEIMIDVAKILELPVGAPKDYAAQSPWRNHENKPAMQLRAGEPKKLVLQPFQVVNLDISPKGHAL